MTICAGWFPRQERKDKRKDAPPKIVTRLEWCAIKDQRKLPSEGVAQLETMCGHWIIFPAGIERREPTCDECRASLQLGSESRSSS